MKNKLDVDKRRVFTCGKCGTQFISTIRLARKRMAKCPYCSKYRKTIYH